MHADVNGYSDACLRIVDSELKKSLGNCSYKISIKQKCNESNNFWELYGTKKSIKYFQKMR